MDNSILPPHLDNTQTNEKTAFSGIDELIAAEKYLKKYNAHTVATISQYFSKNSSILEFGAGTGTLLKLWNVKTGKNPDCVEIDVALRNKLIQQGFNCYDSLKSAHRTYDGIYTSNVLEHIKDDLGALKEIHSALKKDALLVVYVPAFMCLYSGLDRSVGHYRRYEKKELLSKLQHTNFEIIDYYFVDCLGFFVSLAVKYFGYKDGIKLGNNKNLQIYDQVIFPLSKALDYLGFKYLFGKNLVVVAKKNEF
jgi:SAM-dependent methyltransferase